MNRMTDYWTSLSNDELLGRVDGFAHKGSLIEEVARRMRELLPIRRALEKAAETMVDHVSCPMVMYGWSHPKGCNEACGMGERHCWLQYFKEEE